MSHNVIPSTPIKERFQAEEEEYAYMMRMPNEFKENDPERVWIFCKRMSEIRQLRNEEAKKEDIKSQKKKKGNHKPQTQTDLAETLGVSTMMISKYEFYLPNEIKTQIQSIPLRHIKRICLFYDITPHYLLGYVDNPDQVLTVNEDGSIKYKEDGTPEILVRPMSFRSVDEISSVEEYENLPLTDVKLYTLIRKLLRSDDETKKICKKLLSEVFEKS